MTSSSNQVMAVGEILVEMMSLDKGEGFVEAQTIRGPFPSGAPAIFIDQMARLGVPTSMIGAVGDDDFGRTNLQRLTSDGVDISRVRICPDHPTAIAFVRYRQDESRDFLFTFNGSAASEIDQTQIDADVARCSHLHIVGSSLSMPAFADYVAKAVPAVKARGGTVSFDPNVRPEIMKDPVMYQRLDSVLDQCDLVLPSEGELAHLCRLATDEEAITAVLKRGIPEIVMKRGARGASRYTQDSVTDHPGFSVNEVDPTGAGDCFGAAYIGFRRLGYFEASALEHACAAGALAVGQQGPMEGAFRRDDIEAFVRQNTQS
jgi:sugar/nucleoside kinase (ribokinase family)